jgi:pantetheine-phosphate adenylyltransferase
VGRKFKTVAVGGTFDEFHKGHRVLLLKAFEVSDRILIGLSTDELVQRMGKPHLISTYDFRLEELKGFLRKEGLLGRAEIMPLHDAYGVTLSKGCVNALVVSRETEKTAEEINKKRRAKRLEPLNIVVIGMVPAYNSKPISTTRIRRGEIDKEGQMLAK